MSIFCNRNFHMLPDRKINRIPSVNSMSDRESRKKNKLIEKNT